MAGASLQTTLCSSRGSIRVGVALIMMTMDGTMMILWFSIIILLFNSAAALSSMSLESVRNPLTSTLPLSLSAQPLLESTSSSRMKEDEDVMSNDASMYFYAFRRALEIGSILGGKVLAPVILSSFLSTFNRQATDHNKDHVDSRWEMFWSTTTPTSLQRDHADISHATRLASALESLGPTYLKFGQALGSRPDVVPPSLAMALSSLQDDMVPFSSTEARDIVERELMTMKMSHLSKEDVQLFVSSFSEQPVAAASIGQVYKAHLRTPSGGTIRVAVKVQRPGVRELVQQDSTMLLAFAKILDSIPSFSFFPQSSTKVTSSTTKQRLVNTKLEPAVREFMSRIFEELDYLNEANNIVTFSNLYSSQQRTISSKQQKKRDKVEFPCVVVPEVYLDWCTEHVLVMEWIDGVKLTNLQRRHSVDNSEVKANDNLDDRNAIFYNDNETRNENLALVKVAIDCTLHQLLVTGTLHADPHAGNLLKIIHRHGENRMPTLAYLDFGLLSKIPERVRDALICAVALQVFERDANAVASLFGELQLIPQHVLEDKDERAALAGALRATFDNALLYSEGVEEMPWGKASEKKHDTTITPVPELKFDKLLDSLSRLVPRFQFDLPPYFINNARALSTLEGIAKSLDPNFNVLTIMYPYALNRLLRNPSRSPVVDRTVQTLIRSSSTSNNDDGSCACIDRQKIRRLLIDSASMTGVSQWRVVWDVVKTRPGRKLARNIIIEELRRIILRMINGGNSKKMKIGEKLKRKNKWYYLKL